MQDLLKVENISKRYGGVEALRGASFGLKAGEVHALMGENGAGKSTLARIIAGAERADTGRILIDGKPVAIRHPLDAQRLGIGIIYQELDLFPSLTVAENIVIGNVELESRAWVDPAALDRVCRPLLDQVGLRCSPRRLLGTLAIGEMQLVAIARALSMKVRILLMDEPTSSLFDDAVENLFRLIRGLKAQGTGVVYVSHKMDEIYRICDRATVLRDGSAVGVRELRTTSAEELIRMMVDRELPGRGESRSRPSAEPLLSVSNLSTGKLRDISFDLRAGEVLGIAGLVGAGRSSLGAALYGLDAWESGEVRLRGRAIQPRTPREAIDCGIGLLPEDRKLQGLMGQMSVVENASLTILDRLQAVGFIRDRLETARVKPVFDRLALKTPSYGEIVSRLSGGNQQKVLFAKCLLSDPQVLFLDDPTRGIDIAAKQDIYRIIAELAAAGKGIILVSSELPELLQCSHRILVLRNGRCAAQWNTADTTPEAILAAAMMEESFSGMSAQPGRERLRSLQSVIGFAGIFLLAILLSPANSHGGKIFLEPDNLTDILRQVSVIGIVALSMTYVILTGGIDLSVGSILALSTSVAAMVLTRFLPASDYGLHIALAILAAVGVSAAVGALNGLVISWMTIQPFVVTLASMIGIRGLAKWLSGNANIDIGFGQDVAAAFAGGFRQKPVVIGSYCALAAIFWIVLSRTVFGRYVRAVGDNEKAGRYSGLPIRRVKIWVYGLSGLLSGFAGVLYAAENHQGNPNAGVAYELDAIAAVVIGGTRLAGGKGSIAGTIIGTLTIGVLTNMLRLNDVDSNVEMMVKAVIIVLAVAVQRRD